MIAHKMVKHPPPPKKKKKKKKKKWKAIGHQHSNVVSILTKFVLPGFHRMLMNQSLIRQKSIWTKKGINAFIANP